MMWHRRPHSKCGKHRGKLHLVGGQVTVETAIGMVFVVAAVVFLSTYVQRAMQGNLFGATQSIGLQFDPRDPHTETQQLGHLSETVQQQVRWGMLGAELLPVGPVDTRDARFPGAHRDWVFSSLPTGPVYREPAFQDSKVDANWGATRTATYDDNR